MSIKTAYFLLLPAFLLAAFLYFPAIFNYVVSEDAVPREWSSWSRCMRYCGPSWQGRLRNCTTPNRGYGKPCQEVATLLETRSCMFRKYPIDGNVGEWGQWGDCSAQCKGAYKVRKRPCDNPKPKYYGLPCDAMRLPTSERECTEYTNDCPIDGKHGAWGKWEECSMTCGGGTRFQYAECVQPQYGGKPCDPPRKKQGSNCNIDPCPKTTTTTTKATSTIKTNPKTRTPKATTTPTTTTTKQTETIEKTTPATNKKIITTMVMRKKSTMNALSTVNSSVATTKVNSNKRDTSNTTVETSNLAKIYVITTTATTTAKDIKPIQPKIDQSKQPTDHKQTLPKIKEIHSTNKTKSNT